MYFIEIHVYLNYDRIDVLWGNIYGTHDSLNVFIWIQKPTKIYCHELRSIRLNYLFLDFQLCLVSSYIRRATVIFSPQQFLQLKLWTRNYMVQLMLFIVLCTKCW
jgi:hypothetical protein